MKKMIQICGLIGTVVLLTTACNKEEQGHSQLTVKMKDAPGDFQQVNVEVIGVEVHHENSGWTSLATNQGIYDLLTLQYNITAVLVNEGSLPAGHINQLRLILGSNNSVMVDSTYYPLSTPSAQQSGLKINVNADFEPNETYEMLIDFDAEKSIVQQGNGSYSLKPVIILAGIIEI